MFTNWMNNTNKNLIHSLFTSIFFRMKSVIYSPKYVTTEVTQTSYFELKRGKSYGLYSLANS